MTEASATSRSQNTWGIVKPLVPKMIIGSIIGAALVGILAVIVGHFDTLHLQLMLTIILIVAFTLFSWYDADVSSKRSHVFALISVGVSFYLLLVGLLKIWIILPAEVNPMIDDYFSPTAEIFGNFAEWVWLAIIARVALLHAHLLLNIHRHYPTSTLRVVARVTMFLIAIIAIMLSLPVLLESVDFEEVYWRTFGAVVILDLLGTILIPLSNALFNPQKRTPYVAQNQLVTQGQQPAYVQNEPRIVPAPPVPVAPQYTAPPAEATTVFNPPVGSVVFEAPPRPNRTLAWPRYTDGTPLPVNPDGTPDFSQVQRHQ